ncbi:CLUMA_CG004207, isoform A [Clunio marinus]|uniref:CLUMA_CG004207, isoform A n=1 Tax=Clunio marinus TaxID=568069 RepID=A0A1J1HSG9_9DIPT|nr:CLUMA_CG004207, isoform A [Clunio marinus]
MIPYNKKKKKNEREKSYKVKKVSTQEVSQYPHILSLPQQEVERIIELHCQQSIHVEFSKEQKARTRRNKLRYLGKVGKIHFTTAIRRQIVFGSEMENRIKRPPYQ